MKLKTLTLAAALVVAATGVASAQSPGRGHGPGYGYGPGHSGGDIDWNQWQQKRRIEMGRSDGSLSPHEYRALIEEQRRIQDLEARFKRDGRLSADELATLRRAQSAASRNIYEERHDRDTARRGWFGWGRR
ncbi:MAG TPA: hypothetical protein PK264_00720 [Hyphomicrobiaceae bacterium]|nr:hypothetical protein [Hyphomicrobiaceae bacterium]